jgi:hypothetical protein
MKRWSRVGPLVLIGVVAIFVVAATIVIKREALGVNRILAYERLLPRGPKRSDEILPKNILGSTESRRHLLHWSNYRFFLCVNRVPVILISFRNRFWPSPLL